MSFSEETITSTPSGDDSRSPSSGTNNPPAWLNTFVRGMSDEQYHDRKQSLDCTTIKVSIPAASTTTKKPGDPPHTVYILHITSGITQWNIRRRYSDFYYIHQLLKKYVIDENFPQLPPKRFFGSNDSKFIEERRIQLERYLKIIVSIPQSWTRIDIVQFLDNENNTLLFVWNFEKMRKMQDALGKMTIENRNQTDRLTEELKEAKEEVQLLKDRIGQMEMFFLQHATGMAPTKLTPTALRTLSGGGGGGGKVNTQDLLNLQHDENEDQISDTDLILDQRSLLDEHDREIIEYDPKIFTENNPEMLTDLSNEENHNYNQQEVVEILKMSKLQLQEQSPKSQLKREEIEMNQSSSSSSSSSNTALTKKKSFNSSEKGKSDNSSTTSAVPSAAPAAAPAPAPIVHSRVAAMSKQIQDAVRMSNELLEDKLQIPSTTSSSSAASAPTTGSSRFRPGELKSDTSPRHLQDSKFSPNLPPLPPPAELSDLDLDESILGEVLSFYPQRSSQSPQSELSIDTSIDTQQQQQQQQQQVSSPKNKHIPEWLDKIQSRFDEVIILLVPTTEHLNERLIVLNYIRTIIHRSLGAQVYPMGSFTTRTFLPGGDIDISAFLTADQLDSWFVRVNEAMCLSSIGNDSNSSGYTLPDGTFKRITIRNVSFINAWVKVVKGIVNNIEVDISANQIGALYAQALIDRIDDYVDKSHLFKRSIFLIKAWCKYESSRYNSYEGGIFGAREGRLSTWSILIMIIWIFNKYGREITHPFQVLVGFLSYFNSFDWTKYALTVHGPVSAEDLRSLPGNTIDEFYLLPLCGGYIPNEILDQYRDRFNSTKESSIARRREKHNNAVNRNHANNANSQESDDNTSVHSEASRHSDEPDSIRSGLSFDYEDDTGRVGGLISYSYYKRGLMNVMDPIQVKHNTTRAVDLNGYKAILESIYNGRKSLIKLCMDMRNFISDPLKWSSSPVSSHPQPHSHSLSLSSSPTRSSSSFLNSSICQDIPIIRKYLENILTKVLEMKHPPIIQQNISDYSILKTSPQHIELSLKYAELILGSIVTPEALAKLIVAIIENKGPLPVGEIGKILQEMTGNENLSNVLRANYRGLKKVVEGFNEIFSVGTEHPFNPLVHLHETYLRIRNECWYDDSKLVHLFVFTPDLSFVGSGGGGGGIGGIGNSGISPRTRTRDGSGGFSDLSISASHDSFDKNENFLGLTKSRSFKEGSYDRGDIKRSGSLSSAPVGIATGMLQNNNTMLASSPGGRNRKNKNNNNAGNGMNNTPLPANPPPRHSKQSQQQSTSGTNQPHQQQQHHQQQQQQQQYLQQQQQQQYFQQYQQIQYQTYLQHQQYYYTQQQQQLALLQQQQAQQSKESGTSTSPSDPTDSESISQNPSASSSISSTVLEESPTSAPSPPPPVVMPPALPMNPGFLMYSMPMGIPYQNPSNTGSNNDHPMGPTSPIHSTLSTSPTATNPFLHGPHGGGGGGGPLPIPMGYYPHIFNPVNAGQSNMIPLNTSSNQQSTSPIPLQTPSSPSSSGHQQSMPVLIPSMMKPPYGIFYGSPPGNGMFGQYGLSPQSVGAYMPPSSLQHPIVPSSSTSSVASSSTSNASSTSSSSHLAGSPGGIASDSLPPSFPRGHTS